MIVAVIGEDLVIFDEVLCHVVAREPLPVPCQGLKILSDHKLSIELDLLWGILTSGHEDADILCLVDRKGLDIMGVISTMGNFSPASRFGTLFRSLELVNRRPLVCTGADD